MRTLIIITLFGAIGLAACASSGDRAFKAAEKAYAAGDLKAADAAYTKALEAEPNNLAYQAARDRIRSERAGPHIEAAKEKEAAEDFAGAAEAWAAAAAVNPDASEYAARRDLNALAARSPGPDERFDALVELTKTYPKDERVAAAHKEARQTAYQHHVSLGQAALAKNDGKTAFEHFERARVIDAKTPDLPVDDVQKAEALSMAADAEALAEADPVAAYELYQAAYAKRPIKSIKRSMDRVRRKASTVISALERARGLVERGRYTQALSAYDRLAKMKGAPASVKDEKAAALAKLLETNAQKTENYIAKNDLRRAERTLKSSLPYLELEAEAVKGLEAAHIQARKGNPKAVLEARAAAGLDDTNPIGKAYRSYAVATARQILESARRLAKRNQADALSKLSTLDDFRDDLPGIEALREEIAQSGVIKLLDEAKAAAKRGQDAEAASSLKAAIEASDAGPEVRAPMASGVSALEKGQYVEAEKAFLSVQAIAPRSRLAEAGIACTRLRRGSAEADAVRVLQTGKGDGERATSVLEASLSLDAGSETAKSGAEGLLGRIQRARPDEFRLPRWVGWAARITGMPSPAQKQLAEGAKAWSDGNLDAAEKSFQTAKETFDGPLVTAALSQLQTLALQNLKSGVGKVLDGDEPSARLLGDLLKSRPDDSEGNRVLRTLLSRAEDHIRKGQDSDAAKLLRLAIIATQPSSAVQSELDKAVNALGASQRAEAETAFQKAHAQQSAQPVAEVGHRALRAARYSALSEGLKAATTGKGTDPVRQALVLSVTVDPDDAVIKKHVDALIAAAAKQQKTEFAGELLEAANGATVQKKMQSALTEANDNLKKGRFDAARSAYEAIDSPIAKAGAKIARTRATDTLLSRLAGLESGADIEEGAQAALVLYTADPADARVARAVKAVLARAKAAVSKKDDARAARELQAAAIAMGDEASLKPAVDFLSAGQHAEAATAFSKHKTKVAQAGAEMANQRRIGQLTEDLAGGGLKAAAAIRMLLDLNPKHTGAKRAFEKLLDRAKNAGRRGQDAEAAEALREASVASGGPEKWSALMTSAADHLKATRYPEAEVDFNQALAMASGNPVTRLGQEIAKQRRTAREKETLETLKKAEDPRPAAEILKTSLFADASAEAVTQGLDMVLARVEKMASEGRDAETLSAFEAATALAALSGDTAKQTADAIAHYQQGSYAKSQAAFLAISDTRVGRVGAKAALERQIVALEQAYITAEKGLDVIEQKEIIEKILVLDPKRADAKKRQTQLESKVTDARVASAREQIEQGNHGLAFVYAARALELEPDDGAAQAVMTEIKEALKKRLDLVIVVERIRRTQKLGRIACKGFDEMLREQLMTVSSERTDLGGYVLSPAWTELYEKKDKRAPEVSGGLELTMLACKIGPATGVATFEWRLFAPRSGGVVTKGEMTARLPSGKIPKDEQDGAGNNARRVFVFEGAKQVTEAVAEARDEVEGWLLTIAEHGIEKKDTAQVADAFARLKVRAKKLVDVERLLKVETYLAENIR